MHNDHLKRTHAHDHESEIDAVIAADDTGMIAQHEILVQNDLEENGIGDAESRAAFEAERK